MAEWRIRGYVADSDDEDEPPNSLQLSHDTGGTPSNEDHAVHDAEKRSTCPAKEGLGREAGKERKNEEPKGNTWSAVKATAVLGFDEHRNKDGRRVTTNGRGIKGWSEPQPQDSDIDELQEDRHQHSTAARLHPELHLETQASATLTTAHGSSLDRRSSPLSSSPLPTFRIPLKPLERPSQVNKNRSDPSPSDVSEISEGNISALMMDPVEPAQITSEAGSIKATRSLRQRNPIQVHPYAIESEHYRQVLKARGVKPLRITQMEAEADNQREEELQNMDYSEEETQDCDMSSIPNNSGSSPPLDSDDLAPERMGPADDATIFGDDELPDVNALLSNPASRYVTNGYKRQKVAFPSFRMPPRMTRVFQEPPPDPSFSQIRRNDDNVCDEPLSPPCSGSQTPVKNNPLALPRFRQPRQVSKATLPTPATSSEPRKQQTRELLRDDLSDSSSPIQIESLASSGETGSDQASSPEKGLKQLHDAKRRIRGVLPASWLKIDLKTQNKVARDVDKPHRSPSPERLSAQRGVARVSGKGVKNFEVPIDYYEASSKSDSEDAPSQSHSSAARPERPSGNSIKGGKAVLDDRWGEAVEDDQIDAMLPLATRQRHHTHKNKRRQIKLTENGVKSGVTTRGRHAPAQSHDPTCGKNVDALDRGHRRKFETLPPKLSILDTVSSNSNSRSIAPSFIRVAQRTVRSRQDQGRHRPPRKHLRLATKSDDDDANETLRNWREGTIVPKTKIQSHHKSTRQPLNPRSSNNARKRCSQDLDQSQHGKSPGLQSLVQHSSPLAVGKSQSLSDHHLNQRSKETIVSNEAHERPGTTRQPEKRAHLISSIRQNSDARQAMLETLDENADMPLGRLRFHRDLTTTDRFDDKLKISNVLQLFNKDAGKSPQGRPLRDSNQASAAQPERSTVNTKQPKRRTNRKRQPRYMDVSGLWATRSETLINVHEATEDTLPVDTSILHRGKVVTGLEPFGVQYSEDFGMAPLPPGICFHEDTLLGSGFLAKSLRIDCQSLLFRYRGHQILHLKGQTRRWGPWNDTVSSELGDVITWIIEAYQNQPREDHQEDCTLSSQDQIAAFQAIILYLSDHLSFLDPVDRLSCVQRCKTLIALLSQELDVEAYNKRAADPFWEANALSVWLQLRSMVLIFTSQVCQLSQHELIDLELRDELQSLVLKIARLNLGVATSKGFAEIETFLAQCKQADTAAYVLRGDQAAVQAFIVAQHVIEQHANHTKDHWNGVELGLPTKMPNENIDALVYEGSWRRMFTLLPLLEFDSHGVLETGRRFQLLWDHWPHVKQLIEPILEASLSNPRGQMPSFNDYFRALFRRCLHLINGWGWRRCESIVGTLFDYFAHNQLAHLKSEQSHGSPLFLEQLAENPSLFAVPGDCCFHLLLKIIASGIKYMRSSYPEKKIRDIIWRLMPNHGRLLPKEEAVHQADLDALRNHHDLLCILYWSSPPSCRLRLTAIRNLVHVESSHREACHINIRAWLNLVKYQLSTDESLTCLDGFAIWHDDLLNQILRQHGHARTEAEDQVRSVQHAGGLNVSNELLESTISKNQRSVEAMLCHALVSLKLAIDSAQTEQGAYALVTEKLTKTFDIFDAGKPQSVKPVMHALELLSSLASKSKDCKHPSAHDPNDDSQDYGDWSAFEKEENTSAGQGESEFSSELKRFQDPLRQLISNVFGSDSPPDDVLLVKVVDVWVSVAQQLVRSRARTWNDYVDPFGKDSWSSLRDTEQTRKYTVLYLAMLIDTDRAILDDHAHFFLRSWISSLVERESLLKFQHRLTEALLNARCNSPILFNLPFWTKPNYVQFSISAANFSERRMSLISSVLSNLRVSLEEAVSTSSVEAVQLRQVYKDMLKHLMGAMKHNYQALGHCSIVQGAYVDFVHAVVELLQQHAANICPVDRFFTDNAAFPLPATDPTYVVGQLRNYALRLLEPRTPKQLAVFLQSVSERAAVDAQQPYLTGQLHTAMSNAFEDGVSPRPTLRSFLVKAIVPAYIELACNSLGASCGWILAMPYLQALGKVFDEILLDLDGTNPSSVEAVASTITAFLDSVRHSFGDFLSPTNLPEAPGTLKLIAACYTAIIALLPTMDYMTRLSGPTKRAIRDVGFFEEFAAYISECLQEQNCAYDLDRDDHQNPEYADICHFVAEELKEILMKHWSYVDHEQQYYFTKGASRKAVVVDVGLYEEERANLLAVLCDFDRSVAAMPALCDPGEDLVTLPRARVCDSNHLII